MKNHNQSHSIFSNLLCLFSNITSACKSNPANIFLGAGLSIILIRILISALPKHEEIWLTYFILIFITIFAWNTPSLYKKIFVKHYGLKHSFSWGIFAHSFFVIFIIFLGLNIQFPLTVKKQAEITAEGKPYCIEIANNNGDYRQAGSFLDFSPLGMFAKEYQNHAIMIVLIGNTKNFYHWSYWKNKFVSKTYWNESHDNFPLLCKPEINFIGKLPVVFPKKTTNDLELIIGTKHLVIPANYVQRVGTDTRIIEILAKSINFIPLNEKKKNISIDERIEYTIRIELNPHDMKQYINPIGNYTVKDLDKEYNLKKRLITYNPLLYKSEPLYFSLDQTGDIKTIINGGHHYFTHEGWLYTFRLNDKGGIKNWETSQNNLIKLMKSFEKTEELITP